MRKMLILFFLLGAAAFFFPKFASFGWAKRQVEAHLARQLGGEVTIEKLSLSYWNEQKCQNVVWTDSKNGLTLQAEEVVVLSNLFDCIQYKEKPLTVHVLGAGMKSHANFRFIKKKKRKELEILFSPIRAKIENGVIAFEKMDLDINTSMKVSTWGTIDFKKEQLNITLGLPPQTLKKIFKEAKNLPEDFLLEIPISTKLSSRALENALLGFFLKNYSSITKAKS